MTNKKSKNILWKIIENTENLGKKELAATPYHRIKRFVSTLDLGRCSGMNDQPGKDTDVISRPSESTIKDLSFYIGFTRIQSRIKHLGPCFGTNGHFRRDPDVISRLPDTTIHFLSGFIGFRISNRLKIVILGENICFIWKFIEKMETNKIKIFFFDPGIILDHFKHLKSIFWYRKLKFLWNFTKKNDQNINCLCKNRFFD